VATLTTAGAAPGEGPPRAVAAALLSVCGVAWGLAVAGGAHLLHFDAKAHLLVARRVIDSVTPGWIQLGAVWLPLPHILNAVPAQSDGLYQTGAFASALGFAAFAGGLLALGAAAARAAGDRWAGIVAMAVPALNPGWLYLQATPMTEPLYFGLVAALALFVVRWRERGAARDLWLAAGAAALACLVRYEAWPVAAAAAIAATWRVPGLPAREAVRRRLPILLGVGLVLPVGLFGVHSWAATERAFYVIDGGNLTETGGDAATALLQLVDGLVAGFGAPLVVAAAGALLIAALRPHPLATLSAALCGPAVVTFTAYLAGHPTKARYPLLLAPAFALALAAVTRRRRLAQAAVLALAALQPLEAPQPLPVLREATRDRRAVAVRLPAVEHFRKLYRGGRLLASMGSTAPVLFETRLPVREIVHEGNGNYWDYAVVDPERYVAWILIADGDVLDQVRAYRRAFPEGFVPVWRGASVTFYARAGAAPFPVPGEPLPR
jgi:hypothetical protein